MVPYVYERADQVLSQMQRIGIIILGLVDEYQPGFPTYFCKHCQAHHYFISTDKQKIAAKKSYAKKQKKKAA